MEEVIKCRVIKPHQQRDQGELTLKIGDVLDVLKRGKFIWYGRLDDTKGFFPCENVELMEETNLKIESENPLSSSALANKEKGKELSTSADTTKSEDVKMSKDAFVEIESTTPLEDKRRSRPRSLGRPPSQLFIKENILQRSSSGTDILDANSDEESFKKQISKKGEASPSPTKITSISQVVFELKQKPHLKNLVQKEVIMTTSTTTSIENSTDPPAWMRALQKKKSTSIPPKTPDDLDKTPPWMKEVRQRREHKLSLRGDEASLQIDQDMKVLPEGSRQAKVDIQSFESRTTNKAATEEKQKVRTDSFTMVSSEIGSSKSSISSSSKIMQSYSFSEENTDVSMSTSTKKIENEMQQNVKSLLPIMGVTDDNGNLTSNVEKLKNNTRVTDIAEDIKTPKGENEDSHATENIKPLEKVELSTRVFEIEPTVDNKKSEVKVVKETNKKADDTKTNANQSNVKQEEKTAESIKLLLKKIETLETKSKDRLAVIQNDIQNLQTIIQQQYQEVTSEIKNIKSELSALIDKKQIIN